MEGQQGDEIADVGVEYLCVRSVCGVPNFLQVVCLTEVLDVCEDGAGAILFPACVPNVRGEARVDERDGGGIPTVEGERADDEEPTAEIQLAREVPEDGAERGQRERVGTNVAKSLV